MHVYCIRLPEEDFFIMCCYCLWLTRIMPRFICKQYALWKAQCKYTDLTVFHCSVHQSCAEDQKTHSNTTPHACITHKTYESHNSITGPSLPFSSVSANITCGTADSNILNKHTNANTCAWLISLHSGVRVMCLTCRITLCVCHVIA